MRYGVPYRGSKNRIAKWLMDQLPPGETLVDLFAGGCAVTHAALLSGKWSHIIANDLSDAPKLFEDAINGKYADETRWISREDFFRLKDTDPYISLCWSFGNNRRDYLYSKEIEPWKKALHYARVFGDTSLFREFGINTDGTRHDIRVHFPEFKQKYVNWFTKNVESYAESKISLETLRESQGSQNLERVKKLETLQRLESFTRLERLQRDYKDVPVPPGAVVYADPPYKDTGWTGYSGEFDQTAFESWLASVPFMVIVSGYTAPEGCTEVASKQSRCTMGSANKNGETVEKLFVQDRFVNDYMERMQHDRP